MANAINSIMNSYIIINICLSLTVFLSLIIISQTKNLINILAAVSWTLFISVKSIYANGFSYPALIEIMPLLCVTLTCMVVFNKDFWTHEALGKRFEILCYISVLVIWISFLVTFMGINKCPTSYLEDGYRSGLYDLPHAAAYYLIFTYIYINYKRIQYKSVLLLFNLFLIVVTSVRSALLGILCFIIIDFICKMKIRNLFTGISFNKKGVMLAITSTCFSLTLLLNIFAFNYELIISQMNASIDRFALLGEFDEKSYGSGRSIFQKAILDDWNTFDLSNKLIGKDMTSLINVTFNAVGVEIWAHNDMLNIMYVQGLLGLGFYIFVLFVKPWLLITLKEYFSIALLLLILIFSNGLYTYLSAPIIILFWSYIIHKENLNSHGKKIVNNINFSEVG
jgi:hypothetical protein